MAHRFFRDAHGDLKAETGRARRLLGRFLEADIQGSKGMCDEVLAVLDDIAAGRRRRWRMTGNAYTLTVGKRRARIHAEFGRSADLVLPASDLRLALLDWQELLENASRHRSR